MSRKRTSMRKIKEILRLSGKGLSPRQIAKIVKIGRTTVQDHLQRSFEAGINLEIAESISEEELEQRLFKVPRITTNRALPCWETIHLEHRKSNVTLQVLWEEYRDQEADGLSYSYFCNLYRKFSKTVDLSMRQVHKAGEKMFVDYCGKTVEIIDSITGEIRQAQIFVAILGASNYLYAEATWSQQLSDWISSHVRALEFFGGVPKAIVVDNLKSGVTSPSYYDPDINPSYAEFARHYDTVILPARIKKPKDKAKAEAGVQLVQRWLLAKLRHQKFFSLTSLNRAIQGLLITLNDRPFRKLEGCRRSIYESLEKAVLMPLPISAYEFAAWKNAKVNIDYHVEFKKFFYSVIWREVHQRVRIRATASTIEIFKADKRIAVHPRKYTGDRYSTLEEHMPPQHKAMKWNPGKLVNMAAKIGESVKSVIETILNSRPHPEQGYRASLGVLRLGRLLGNDRLINACKKAIEIGSPTYKSIKAILENGQDRCALSEQENRELPKHQNIRGSKYYKKEENTDAASTNH